jgi:hypothetical protein
MGRGGRRPGAGRKREPTKRLVKRGSWRGRARAKEEREHPWQATWPVELEGVAVSYETSGKPGTYRVEFTTEPLTDFGPATGAWMLRCVAAELERDNS